MAADERKRKKQKTNNEGAQAKGKLNGVPEATPEKPQREVAEGGAGQFAGGSPKQVTIPPPLRESAEPSTTVVASDEKGIWPHGQVFSAPAEDAAKSLAAAIEQQVQPGCVGYREWTKSRWGIKNSK